MQAAPVPPRVRTGRLALLTAILLVVQTVTILRTHLYFNLYLAASSLPQITIVLLLVVCLINRVLKRRLPKAALTGAEMALMFGCLLLTAAIPQSAVCENVVSVAVTPAYFSSAENHWQSLFFGRMPEWLRVTDAAAAKNYYEGLPRGGSVPRLAAQPGGDGSRDKLEHEQPDLELRAGWLALLRRDPPLGRSQDLHAAQAILSGPDSRQHDGGCFDIARRYFAGSVRGGVECRYLSSIRETL